MPVMYNDYVKKPSEERDWTQEELDELRKCATDITHFLKHIKIVTLDKGRQTFKPFQYQKDMIKMFSENPYNIVLSSRQSGKCSVYASEVIIKDNETNEIKEIPIGELFDTI